MIYVYDKVQNPVAGTIFLMSEHFDSGKYEKYVLKHYGYNGEIAHREFTHEKLEEMLKNKVALRMSKPNFANYKEFIKIPLHG